MSDMKKTFSMGREQGGMIVLPGFVAMSNLANSLKLIDPLLIAILMLIVGWCIFKANYQCGRVTKWIYTPANES